MSNNEPKYSFEEFKLIYESAEKVTDRRHEANRWNYTVCIGVLLAIAVIINYSISNMPFFYIGFISVIVLSAVAIFFCIYWFKQILDFKKLNTAKFYVLNKMAPNVEYNPDNPGIITPFCSFEKEWKKLEEINALQKPGKKKFVALRATFNEKFIPLAFIVLFIGIVFVVSVLILPNRDTYIESSSNNSKIGTVIEQPKKQ